MTTTTTTTTTTATTTNPTLIWRTPALQSKKHFNPTFSILGHACHVVSMASGDDDDQDDDRDHGDDDDDPRPNLEKARAPVQKPVRPDVLHSGARVSRSIYSEW